MSANVERLKAVRNAIAAEPPKRLKMEFVFTGRSGRDRDVMSNKAAALLRECGTAACVAGWALAVGDFAQGSDLSTAADWLGLSPIQRSLLFTPPNFDVPGRYTKADALAALNSLIAYPDGMPVWPQRSEGA